ncbi:ABC transporter ATP-binding protein [Trujillonella endophytica]|uniref:Peptide/nickel transport system ATP-binding protein n=1 Tax=Trujillonella endophytica TaxID=673521 RepID=A0A1H8Q7Q2_9ACTN|nr:ATP-binding cassette domain-containing protein [Trujillella endophytica]SEO49783.1 peptide/nickel transport system ATP-binding protein [Trujillella endophytica]
MSDLVEVQGLRKAFAGRKRFGRKKAEPVAAVDDVSFSIPAGETLALVGESGAGKSTVGRMAIRLIEPDSGSVTFDGGDVLALGSAELRRWRRNAQMVFQDPFTSLDPHLVIGQTIEESLQVHGVGDREERHERMLGLLDRVGIRPDQADRYPFEFSGGQLQRIAIARALAPEPRFIVCDEPVAALDMSIRASVLNLLRDLQEERGLSYLFVTHDLSLVRAIAHRTAVMRQGRIVEMGPTQRVFDSPEHPYTRTLLAAVPIPDPRIQRDRSRTVGQEVSPAELEEAPASTEDADPEWTTPANTLPVEDGLVAGPGRDDEVVVGLEKRSPSE